ncbi:Gfo/Idh/MocA family oxidoreductase [Flagellimonas myxillae]|uniref:Gfo/Idh/MocA family protein n=1 Tax=Flagellimonas myxillae TaxID=2942214 RepID=UPI0029E8068F|nr:Gfo/Idh/MocA family oxidoreductase [Muricauda myxillae]
MTESLSFLDKTPIRWGVIGCGSVAEKKSVPAYQMVPGFEVAMVMRRDADKVKDYAERHGIAHCSTNALEVIQNPEIDAIYIATPPDSHREYALLVAEAGKPCCIEKPMAPTYKESLEIHNAFQEKGLPLFIAYYRRSLPRFNQIKEWLDEQRIGQVRHIQWTKTKPPTEMDLSGAYNWRTDAKIAPGGYFDDLASHGLDLFAYLLGNIKKAQGFTTNQQGLYSAHDSVVGSWIHETGVTGDGVWNFGTHHRKDQVEILGSNGKITFAVLDEAPLVLETANERQELHVPNPEHIQQYHAQYINDHLRGLSQHPSLGTSGLHTSWVMDQILGN